MDRPCKGVNCVSSQPSTYLCFSLQCSFPARVEIEDWGFLINTVYQDPVSQMLWSARMVRLPCSLKRDILIHLFKQDRAWPLFLLNNQYTRLFMGLFLVLKLLNKNSVKQ